MLLSKLVTESAFIYLQRTTYVGRAAELPASSNRESRHSSRIKRRKIDNRVIRAYIVGPKLVCPHSDLEQSMYVEKATPNRPSLFERMIGHLVSDECAASFDV